MAIHKTEQQIVAELKNETDTFDRFTKWYAENLDRFTDGTSHNGKKFTHLNGELFVKFMKEYYNFEDLEDPLNTITGDGFFVCCIAVDDGGTEHFMYCVISKIGNMITIYRMKNTYENVYDYVDFDYDDWKKKMEQYNTMMTENNTNFENEYRPVYEHDKMTNILEMCGFEGVIRRQDDNTYTEVWFHKLKLCNHMTIITAAKKGDLASLIHAIKNGGVCSPIVMKRACTNGRLECIKYLHEVCGMEIRYTDMTAMANSGKRECFEYGVCNFSLSNEECAMEKMYMLFSAIHHDNLEFFRYLVEKIKSGWISINIILKCDAVKIFEYVYSASEKLIDTDIGSDIDEAIMKLELYNKNNENQCTKCLKYLMDIKSGI